MHLLATTSGVIDGAAEAADLKQSPADIVILSSNTIYRSIFISKKH
jgi:cobaltochelatase CobN